jgi:uncharacterized protein (TIRG00374 family)
MIKIPRSISLLIKCLLSLTFFSVLVSFVQGNELAQIFSQLNWFYMVITFAVTLVMVIASCAKWKLIFDLKEQSPSFFQLFKIYLIGYFFSNILPSTVGGDVVRSYYAGKLIQNQSYAAVSVFVERFSGIFFLFIVVTIAPAFQPGLFTNPYLLVPAFFGLSFALLTVWIWLARNPFALPNRLATKIFELLVATGQKLNSPLVLRLAGGLENFYLKNVGRLRKLRQELQIALDAIKNDRTFVVKLVALTALFYVLTWVNVYTAFKAFDVEVDFLKICAIVPAIMLVAHIPVTLLGNLGYFESVFVFYFLLVGVGGAESLAMGLLLRLKMLLMGLMGFFTYLVYKQKNKLLL